MHASKLEPVPGTRLVPILLLVAIALCLPGSSAAQESLLNPPDTEGPLEVRVGLHLLDIVEIDEGRKTVEIEAVLTLAWQDQRLRFNPAEAGADELVYQGDYQFSEIATGWWPQLFLRNEAGAYERQGLLLRVRPDGSVQYDEEFRAVAEVDMDLRRIPFDDQLFTLYFEPLGFAADEVRLEPEPDWTSTRSDHVSVQQWDVGQVSGERQEVTIRMQSGRDMEVSAVAFSVPASRDPGFLLRVIVLPLLILVGLSWSVFWMDTSQLSDRMAISFLGILTVVAFQIVVSEMLPRITYFTILSSFLLISYLVLVASVIVNLTVGALDRAGRVIAGNRLDQRCRWLFPIAFVAVNLLVSAYFFVRY
jgi:hypothetical protein